MVVVLLLFSFISVILLLVLYNLKIPFLNKHWCLSSILILILFPNSNNSKLKF